MTILNLIGSSSEISRGSCKSENSGRLRPGSTFRSES